MKLIVRNVDIKEFKEYLGIVGSLITENRQDGLNTSLFYRAAENTLHLILKEALSFVEVDIPCDLENEGITEDWGVAINSNTLSYIISSYQEAQLQSMVWELGESPRPFFRVRTTYDDLSLPTQEMSRDQISELRELLTTPFPARKFSLSEFGDSQKDFLAGIADCMNFISDDEKKKNAVSLYNSHMIVNDERHIFIFNYDQSASYLEAEVPYVLHKRIARTMLTFLSRKGIGKFDVLFSEDQKRVCIESTRFTAVLNNSLANVAPPSAEDLQGITPDIKVANPLAASLLETTSFFQGFYPSGAEYHPLVLNIHDDAGVKFMLRDDGVGGYNSCNIERFIPMELFVKDFTCVSTVLNDSIMKFIKTLPKEEETVSLYMDASHPSVLFAGKKKRIYLARLK